VTQSETAFFGLDEVPASPVDSLGGVISPRQNVMFESVNKGSYEHLPSRINSVFQSPFSVTYSFIITTSGLYYINGYGMEIHPSPNPEFLSNLASRKILIYSCGSLWTRYLI
jgi:hypothetical protein